MIIYKTETELGCMKQAGKILANLHVELQKHCKVGQSAEKLDRLAYQFIKDHHAEPSFLGYRGYKHTVCVSKNEEIVHGIPYPDKILYPGDICSIDAGVCVNGYHVDAARTHIIETATQDIQHLVNITETAFFKALEQIRPGNRLGDIGHAIQSQVESQGFNLANDLYSHGVGKYLHEDPLIPNRGKKGKGLVIKKGMTMAIEPMVNMGTSNIVTLEDGWTIVTQDRKWSAHYENTVYVSDSEAVILTL